MSRLYATSPRLFKVDLFGRCVQACCTAGLDCRREGALILPLRTTGERRARRRVEIPSSCCRRHSFSPPRRKLGSIPQVSQTLSNENGPSPPSPQSQCSASWNRRLREPVLASQLFWKQRSASSRIAIISFLTGRMLLSSLRLS